MINLLNFYKDHVNKDEYYYKFYYNLVESPQIMYQEMAECFGTSEKEDETVFEIFDEEEAIEKFKYLCQPDTRIDSTNKRIFYFVCFYLLKNGYTIKEFPRILKRPPEDPFEFIYKEMRTKLVSMGKQRSNGDVPYAERRILVANLTFEKKSLIPMAEDIDSLFVKISTRNASFKSMTIDEKIKEITNLIEYMLEENGKFKELDYNEIAFFYLNNELVKKFRKQFQCFRHASQDALNERKKFSVAQKEFIVEYGIIIIKTIYQLISI